jgi:hypothetical protein
LSEVSNTTITVQFSRKMGRENYGNEEVGIFAQIPVDPGVDLQVVEKDIKQQYAFLKTLVYEQLGVDSVADDNGIVRDVPQAPVAKPQAKGGSRKVDKTTLWQQLVEGIGTVGTRDSAFFDNRPKKASGDYSPKSPDFKHKESGEGLWLDKAPEFVKLALDSAPF